MSGFDTSFVYLCPRCHTAAIDVSTLEGGGASCRGCGWSGQSRDVIAAPFHHQHGESDLSILRSFANDLKSVFRSGMMQPLAVMLDKWGFFPEEASPEQRTALVIRYAKAAANAMLRAIIEERQSIGDDEAKRKGMS